MITKEEILNSTNVSLFNESDKVKQVLMDVLSEHVFYPYDDEEAVPLYPEYEAFFKNNDVATILSTDVNEITNKVYEAHIDKCSKEVYENYFVTKDKPCNKLGFKKVQELVDSYITEVADGFYLSLDEFTTFLRENNCDIEKKVAEKQDEGEEPTNDTYSDVYCVSLKIAAHRDHTVKNLAKRIDKRLRYKWDGKKVSVLVTRESNSNKYFKATVFIAIDDDDFENVFDMVKFRLGKTSGNPWPRCRITGFEKVEGDEIDA